MAPYRLNDIRVRDSIFVLAGDYQMLFAHSRAHNNARVGAWHDKVGGQLNLVFLDGHAGWTLIEAENRPPNVTGSSYRRQTAGYSFPRTYWTTEDDPRLPPL